MYNGSMKKFLIIDTFNFFHRAYYALPASLTTPDGTQVNAVYGVASMLLSIFDLISPDYVVAALESKEKVNRKKQFEDYKAHRKPMDEELTLQIPLLFELPSRYRAIAHRENVPQLTNHHSSKPPPVHISKSWQPANS